MGLGMHKDYVNKVIKIILKDALGGQMFEL